MAAEWIRVNGGDPGKVKFLELPFPDMNTDLERGSIAAAHQGEPFLSNAKATQRPLGVPFEAMGKPFYINVYAASRATSSRRRSTRNSCNPNSTSGCAISSCRTPSALRKLR